MKQTHRGPPGFQRTGDSCRAELLLPGSFQKCLPFKTFQRPLTLEGLSDTPRQSPLRWHSEDFKSFFSKNACGWVYLHEFVSMTCSQKPTENRAGHWIACSYRWVWNTMWILETELGSYTRVVGTLNNWVLSPAPEFIFFFGSCPSCTQNSIKWFIFSQEVLKRIVRCVPQL